MVDIELIRQLRSQLHCVKKTFTGKEFVDTLLVLSRYEDSSESSSNEMISHQTICYNSEYAIELGQYLLDNGLLCAIVTANHIIRNTPNPSEAEASTEGFRNEGIFSLTSSYRFTEAEDKRVNIRKHQVLQAVKEKVNKKGQQLEQLQQPSEERGRLGTILLISDILLQRSHQDRRLREFTRSNRFQELMRQLNNGTMVTCLCIVHL